MDAKQLLDKYKKERQNLILELRSLQAIILRMESDLGLKPEGGEEIDLGFSGDIVGDHQPVSREPEIRPDEFFNKSQGDAAMAYLEKVGQAVPVNELVEVLKKGGCKVGGADPKRTLYISLVRDTRNFVPVQPGVIGLRKFYGNQKPPAKKGVKRSSDKKKKKSPSDNVKKKPKPAEAKNLKKASSPKPKEEKKRVHKSKSPITATVKEILNDGSARSVESIQKSVEEKLNRPIKLLVINSILRMKDFEKIGAEYRLTKN